MNYHFWKYKKSLRRINGISLLVLRALNYANAGFGAIRGPCHEIRMAHFHMTPEGGHGFELIAANYAQISLVHLLFARQRFVEGHFVGGGRGR